MDLKEISVKIHLVLNAKKKKEIILNIPLHKIRMYSLSGNVFLAVIKIISKSIHNVLNVTKLKEMQRTMKDPHFHRYGNVQNVSFLSILKTDQNAASVILPKEMLFFRKLIILKFSRGNRIKVVHQIRKNE